VHERAQVFAHRQQQAKPDARCAETISVERTSRQLCLSIQATLSPS
jgi:hypothetical protein